METELMGSGKVVIISAVIPIPADSGKKVVLSGLLGFLVDRFGSENIHYVYVGSAARDVAVSKAIGCEVTSLPAPSSLNKIWNILWFVFLRNSKSFQEAMLYSRELAMELRTLVGSINPSIVVYDTIRMGQFVEDGLGTGKFNILYLEDLFSKRYEKLLDTLRNYPAAGSSILGNFESFVPSFLRSLIRLRYIQALALNIEKARLENRERDLVPRFNRSLLLNSEEARALRKSVGLPSCADIRTIKPILSVSRFDAQRCFLGGFNFVFLGSLNYPPNEISLTHFLRSQINTLVARLPDFKLRIVGRGASAELLSIVQQNSSHLTIEGYVEDLDQVFNESCAMLVPLLFGSGVKLKVLEAFAKGLPVISTTCGVEGIPVASGVECIVEDDISSFVDHMLHLSDPQENLKYSKVSQEFYLSNYARKVVSAEYDEIFRINRQDCEHIY